MDTIRVCPGCGKALAADAPQGICPECLMKAGFGTAAGTEAGGGSGFVPPTVQELAKLFPQLEILELIGRGGMGAVYKARQPGLDRLVAFKILPPQTGSDPGFAERFTREARALARLSHPNIVPVYDFGQVSGAGVSPATGASRPSAAMITGGTPAPPLHYFIMEYVDGANLRQLEQAGRLSPREALSIITQICEALQFAHDEGIVHRDIKPENVLVDKKGRVKIADFGLAKILGRESIALRLTGARDVMGTPHYMAPEQIEHPHDVDHRADIYSLGVVFYEMLTGELPLGRFAAPSKKVQVDVRLDEVVLHALEKEPGRRYQHASQVKTDLESIAARPSSPSPPLTHRPSKAAKWLLLAGASVIAVVVAMVSLAGFLYVRRAKVETPGVAAVVKPVKAFSTEDKPISGNLIVTEGQAWLADCAAAQTLRLFEVPNPGLERCKVIYRAKLKTEGLAGRAYLEMWCQFPGLGEAFSRGLDNVVTGSNDWATYQIPFFLKAGEKPDLIRLNLVVEGTGKVFIKDVELMSGPLPGE